MFESHVKADLNPDPTEIARNFKANNFDLRVGNVRTERVERLHWLDVSHVTNRPLVTCHVINWHLAKNRKGETVAGVTP